MLACDSPAPERVAPIAGQVIHLDEREVLRGHVVERLEGQDYVYLRLAVTHSGDEGPPLRVMRWIALDHSTAQLGDRVRVRSLARRTRVWDPKLERDFEQLDYVAELAL